MTDMEQEIYDKAYVLTKQLAVICNGQEPIVMMRSTMLLCAFAAIEESCEAELFGELARDVFRIVETKMPAYKKALREKHGTPNP
jgi:hypothetical protein